MSLQFYGNLVAKINGELLSEQCAITLVQAQGKPDRITVASVTPATGLEFNAHERIGHAVHVSLHTTTGRLVKGYQEPGPAIVAYDARIVAAELTGAVNAIACTSFTCEALPRPETP